MLSKTYNLSANGYTLIFKIIELSGETMNVEFTFKDQQENTQIFEGDLFNKEGYYIHNPIHFIIDSNIGLLIEDVDIPRDYHDELHENIKEIVFGLWNDLHGLTNVQE
jgi:hypothetical protein